MKTFFDSAGAALQTPRPQRRQADPDNRIGMWSSPAVIAPNNFVYKSLSNWAVNVTRRIVRGRPREQP